MKIVSGVVWFAATLLSLAAHADPSAWEGPFGVQMGLSKEDINAAVPLSPQYGVPNEYSSKTAPKPLQGFDTYVYQIAPGAGLCRVRGETKYAGAPETGRSFEALYQRLIKRYGKPHSYQQDTSALWKGDGLPRDVDAITLAIAKRVTASSAVQLSYRFRNAASCDKPPVVDGKTL